MTFIGLHVLDWVVIVLYVVAVLWVGKATASSVHNQSDFFLGGRKLGPLFQFFLNFGNATDANGAVRTSSVVYSQGVGGVWLMMQLLLITPYYWFMNAWFRRSRLTTMADLFTDRFGTTRLATIYAACNILFGIIAVGGSYLVAYKITEVLVVKPESAYTSLEAERVGQFREYVEMRGAYGRGELGTADQPKYLYLKRLYDRGELKSYVSYVKPLPLYLGLGLIVGIYIILGGLTAAAITDAFQSLLIVVFSVILIPFGLIKLGGLEAFHARIPDRMMEMFGSGGSSEFAWYSIAAILLVTLVQAHAGSNTMGMAGSARTEAAASFGAVSGGFMKRWMTIAWCFCGLIAFALFGEGLSDPDVVWGSLSRTLLGPGFLGLMLVGIVAADVSHMSPQCLSLSALFVRNVYAVILPGRSEKEGLLLGKVMIVLALVGGIGIALLFRDIIAFAKMILTLNVGFGAVILVLLKWRRVTETAGMVTVVLTLFTVVVIPFAVPAIPWLNSRPELHAMTQEQRQVVRLAAGGPTAPNQPLEKVNVVGSKPIFFERIVAANPSDQHSSMHGEGRFHLELFLLSLCGFNLSGLLPAQLFALSYLFDAVFPFILLFGVSLLTRERDSERAQAFYVKMRTKVLADPEDDRINLEKNLAAPDTTERIKLLPFSSWELFRWSKADTVAFSACCLFALFIFGTFFLLLRLGR